MKILGIGNAIVDVICKVDDNFLKSNELTKSTMKLVDEKEFKKLLGNLKIEKTISGGSVANSIVGLSQLGNEVAFIGKVNDDDLGRKYSEGLEKEKVKYHYNIKSEKIPTGTCLILITPDSERTMCTFLGTAGKISENDIDEKIIKKSEITFLEGYLWDKGDPQKAFNKAIKNSLQSAMSLSDLFCVERHKEYFLDLVQSKLNITFANEQEIMALIGAKNFEEALTLVNDHEFGNGVSIFTRDGDVGRSFSSKAKIGMVGINIPIPVPMAFHSFGGWKRSLFGDQHMHGPEGVRFYTKLKTITSRWPDGLKSDPEFVMPTMK